MLTRSITQSKTHTYTNLDKKKGTRPPVLVSARSHAAWKGDIHAITFVCLSNFWSRCGAASAPATPMLPRCQVEIEPNRGRVLLRSSFGAGSRSQCDSLSVADSFQQEKARTARHGSSGSSSSSISILRWLRRLCDCAEAELVRGCCCIRSDK